MCESYIARAQRVLDRGRKHSGHRDRATLSRPLHTQRIEWAGCRDIVQLNSRHIHRGRHEIVHERSGEDLPAFVMNDFFEKRVADTKPYSPDDLTIDNQGIDDITEVLNSDVSKDTDFACARVDLDKSDMTPGCERICRRAEASDSTHARPELSQRQWRT